eukprot:15329587-Alexandrium_andersonii.AAC.1
MRWMRQAGLAADMTSQLLQRMQAKRAATQPPRATKLKRGEAIQIASSPEASVAGTLQSSEPAA